MKKFFYRVALLLLAVAMVINAFIDLFTTAIRTLAYQALGRHNYWDFSNEWFQVCDDFENWLKAFKKGKHP